MERINGKNPLNFELQEGGSNLSGGQQQRLALLRAIQTYRPVLILDEATSALDDKTESQIMGVINNLDRSITVLIVAHRTSTLKCCDRIVEIQEGELCKVYSSYYDFRKESEGRV